MDVRAPGQCPAHEARILQHVGRAQLGEVDARQVVDGRDLGRTTSWWDDEVRSVYDVDRPGPPCDRRDIEASPEAAKRLRVHPNTLRYRLDRIREIGNFDLEEAETRLNLAVALRVQALLGM